MSKKYLELYVKQKKLKNWEFNSSYKIEKQKLLIDRTVYTLFYSFNEPWSIKYRGKKAAILDDDGDGITIRFKNKSISLDYSEYQELQILIREEQIDNNWEDKVLSFKKKKNE